MVKAILIPTAHDAEGTTEDGGFPLSLCSAFTYPRVARHSHAFNLAASDQSLTSINFHVHNVRPLHAMSLSSFSSLSSYSSESDIGTIFGIGLFKSSRPRRRSPPISVKKRTPSPPRRRRKRSVTPTRTPISSSRYDGAIVPYSLRSPGSKSGISYSDIDRWRAATVGGSDFTYSSESSITQSTVTSSSVVSSSRSRSSRIESSSRRTVASSSRQLQVPSVATRPPHSGIHFDPPQICEHCRRSPLLFLSPPRMPMLFTHNRPTTAPGPWSNGRTSSSPTRTLFRLSRCLPSLPDFLCRCPRKIYDIRPG